VENDKRVGIFGGNFDPFHYGHLNSMVEVGEKFGLEKIAAVPAFISPLRMQIQGSSPEQRAEMARRGISGHEDLIEVDTRELKREGVSYTVDTLNSYPDDEHLFLVIGMDQFGKFDQWKSFDKILERADLIVTSRPGSELPRSLEDWPAGLRPLVSDFDSQQALLKSGRTVYFHQLKDVEASGTEIRRKLRLGQTVGGLMPPGVVDYIRDNKLYQSVGRKIGDFEKFTAFCAGILNDKGGINVQTYDLRDRQAPSEFTLISSGTSTRHASALAEHLTREVKKEYGVWPEGLEGQGEGRWIVVDYGALIVHVFYDFVRQEYRLEELWTKRPGK
jgi:nicotinate-nucleotide adenylyltransferase